MSTPRKENGASADDAAETPKNKPAKACCTAQDTHTDANLQALTWQQVARRVRRIFDEYAPADGIYDVADGAFDFVHLTELACCDQDVLRGDSVAMVDPKARQAWVTPDARFDGLAKKLRDVGILAVRRER